MGGSGGGKRGRTYIIHQTNQFDDKRGQTYTESEDAFLRAISPFMYALSIGGSLLDNTLDTFKNMNINRAFVLDLITKFFALTEVYHKECSSFASIMSCSIDVLPDRYDDIMRTMIVLRRVEQDLGVLSHCNVLFLRLRMKELWAESKQIISDIITPYYRIAYVEASKVSRSDDDLYDYFQSGVEGLMRSVETYTPSLGSFGTYASWWVHQRVKYLHHKDSGLPQSLWKLHDKINVMSYNSEADVDVNDIVKATGFSKKKVEDALVVIKTSKSVYSLDDISDDYGSPHDRIADDVEIDKHNSQDVKDSVRKLLGFLDKDSSIVVALKHGLVDYLRGRPITNNEKLEHKARQLRALATLKGGV